MKTFKIIIPHKGATFEIPMILMYQYANSFLQIDISKYKKFSTNDHGRDLEKILKTQKIDASRDRFDSHDLIFQYTGLTHHRYRDHDTLEDYVQQAIECWWLAISKTVELTECIVKKIPMSRGQDCIVITKPKIKLDFRTERIEDHDETHTEKMSRN